MVDNMAILQTINSGSYFGYNSTHLKHNRHQNPSPKKEIAMLLAREA